MLVKTTALEQQKHIRQKCSYNYTGVLVLFCALGYSASQKEILKLKKTINFNSYLYISSVFKAAAVQATAGCNSFLVYISTASNQDPAIPPLKDMCQYLPPKFTAANWCIQHSYKINFLFSSLLQK